MEGKLLIVSVSSMYPYIDYAVEENAVVLKGVLGELWTILEERLRFSSEYVLENYEDGALNFQNRRRDVLLRPAIVLSEDLDDFDFFIPSSSIWYELYVKDSFEIISSISYIKNLPMDFWISLMVMTALFIMALYIMGQISCRFSYRESFDISFCESTRQFIEFYYLESGKFKLEKNWRKIKNLQRQHKMKNDRSFGNCIITIVAAFTEQGFVLPTKRISIRILLFSFLLFGMIVCNSYSALLVSQLTTHEIFLPFQNLDEIPEKADDFSLCVRPENYAALYFMENNSKKVQRKWKNILNREPCPADGKINLQELCLPYVAFLETPPLMHQLMLKNRNCLMRSLKGQYFNVNFAVLTLKNLKKTEKEEIEKELLKFREIGITSYLRAKWIRSPAKSKGAEIDMQVTYKHIKGVLLVYFCCAVFSSLILLTENLLHSGMKRLK